MTSLSTESCCSLASLLVCVRLAEIEREWIYIVVLLVGSLVGLYVDYYFVCGLFLSSSVLA